MSCSSILILAAKRRLWRGKVQASCRRLKKGQDIMQMKIWNARAARSLLEGNHSFDLTIHCLFPTVFQYLCPEPTLKCKGWNFKRKLPLLFGKDQYWEWGIVIGNSIIDLDPKPHSLCMHLLLIRGREGHRIHFLRL